MQGEEGGERRGGERRRGGGGRREGREGECREGEGEERREGEGEKRGEGEERRGDHHLYCSIVLFRTLAQFLHKQSTPMPERDILLMFFKMVDALCYLHEHKILHRSDTHTHMSCDML